jgi:hypothetical protein
LGDEPATEKVDDLFRVFRYFGLHPMLRKLLALFSITGLIAAIFAYAASFVGLTTGQVTDARPWVFYLLGGALVLNVPVQIIEYDGPLSDRKFYWEGFSVGRPRWSVPAIKTAGLVALAHFALFLILTHASFPQVINNQFVLNDHGTIRGRLSQSEYLALKAWETRFFASFMIFFYLVGALYWWFPSVRPKAKPYDG